MSDSLAVNIGLTAVVIILMVPGLIVEPGPISEVVGVGILASIWGIDWSGGGS